VVDLPGGFAGDGPRRSRPAQRDSGRLELEIHGLRLAGGEGDVPGGGNVLIADPRLDAIAAGGQREGRVRERAARDLAGAAAVDARRLHDQGQVGNRAVVRGLDVELGEAGVRNVLDVVTGTKGDALADLGTVKLRGYVIGAGGKGERRLRRGGAGNLTPALRRFRIVLGDLEDDLAQ